MQIITSFDNQRVKHIVGLKDKKNRQSFGEYITEGARWVFDAVEYSKQSCEDLISLIVVSQSKLETYLSNIIYYEDRILVLSDRVFEKLSDEKNSQGILAVLKIKDEQPIDGKLCVFLDRVRDPANIGTIFRTALAFGFKNILCYDCVDAYNPKVVRSSMTAVLKLNILNADDNSLSSLQGDGYKIVCADINGKNVNKSFEKPDKVCLVIGNEANGISQTILKQSDLNLCIPMEEIESLNAAVSAGILMYLLKYKI